MRKTSVRIRPFNVGGAFEIVLPNGKVILLDPFFTGNTFPGGQTREDVTGADYILLSHTHFDHDIDVGYFVRKFHSKVFVGAMSAMDLLKFHKIPYDNLFPVYPGQKYTLEDFSVEFFQTKHNPSGGRTYDPETADIALKACGVAGHTACDVWGSMESVDFLITTNNNFRILGASGRVIWNELFDVCKNRGPNLLLRQAGVRRGTGDMKNGEQVSPKELAELLIRYQAQTIIPFHHDVLFKRWGEEKTYAYMDQVGEEVEKMDVGAQFINPVAWKWYDIGTDILVED